MPWRVVYIRSRHSRCYEKRGSAGRDRHRAKPCIQTVRCRSELLCLSWLRIRYRNSLVFRETQSSSRKQCHWDECTSRREYTTPHLLDRLRPRALEIVFTSAFSSTSSTNGQPSLDTQQHVLLSTRKTNLSQQQRPPASRRDQEYFGPLRTLIAIVLTSSG